MIAGTGMVFTRKQAIVEERAFRAAFLTEKDRGLSPGA